MAQSSLIRDTNLKQTKAFPAAAATSYTDAIDLIDSAPGLKLQSFQMEVAVEALPSLVDAKVATVTLQDSADGSSFAAVATFPAITFTGAGGAGAAAKTSLLPFPKNIRRFIRLKLDVEAGGGSNIAKSASLSVVR